MSGGSAIELIPSGSYRFACSLDVHGWPRPGSLGFLTPPKTEDWYSKLILSVNMVCVCMVHCWCPIQSYSHNPD